MRRKIAAAFLLAVLSFGTVAGQPYWPTQGWREGTPESQGLDSQSLAEALDYIRDKHPAVHSLLIVRHGHIVLDAYFYPFKPGVVHDAASVTKSVTSALVGIAIDKSDLKSVHEKVAPILAKMTKIPPDPLRDRMTVEDLVTMSPGMDCGFRPGEQELAEMKHSDDWVAFAAKLPMKFEPGSRFGYCSPGFHLLSAILSVRSGTSELEFARTNLFHPLGISEVIWPADEKGRNTGWGNLHLLPPDFAKIGYLYLHGGVWDNNQIVSEDWVRQSTAPHKQVREGQEYGYGWWIYKDRHPRIYEANGRGGQRISVIPDEDMIVVFTGGGFEPGNLAPFIFRSIRSNKPLEENPAGYKTLQEKVKAALRAPAPGALPVLPKIAKTISGKVYVVDANPMDLKSISLSFGANGEARASLKAGETILNPRIGLDGVYRMSPDGPQHLEMGAMGAWQSGDEFVLDLDTIANINHFRIAMRFSGEQVELTLNEATGQLKNVKAAGRVSGARK